MTPRGVRNPSRVQADAYGVRKGLYGARGAQRDVDVGEQRQLGAGQGLGVVLGPHFEERDADQVRGRRVHRYADEALRVYALQHAALQCCSACHVASQHCRTCEDVGKGR